VTASRRSAGTVDTFRLGRIASSIAIVAACVPPLAIAFLVARHARNVPWKDQWGLVPFMVDASRGELSPSALWGQVNEHRIPLAMLVQGLLAWATRWDVRYEAWTNVVLAGLTLLALVGLVRRTIRPLAPGAAAWIVLAISILTFSLAGGINWPWGSLNATYLAGLVAAVLAWQLAAWQGRWLQTIGLLACATAGAFSFGAGVVLVVVLPLALLVWPSVDLERRAGHAIASAAWAAVVIAVYFVGWVPRAGVPRPVMHWDRLAEYARYAVVYVGGGLGTSDVGVGLGSGVAWCAFLVAASVWLWAARPDARAALVPWWLLAAYSLANGVLTAFGRLDDGLFTALFVRYLPTASFFLESTVALTTLAAAILWRQSTRAGVAAFAALAIAIAVPMPSFYVASREGAANMGRLALQLEAGARCLPTCTTAPDGCLLALCWSADVARRMCPLMADARIGPFAP
jgi:hypothetical protein